VDIKQLIFEKWSEIEKANSRRVTLKELSSMVGIEYSYFNHIYNMRRSPTKDQIEILAEYFHDMRFYDVAGIPRPDPILKYLITEWGNLSHAVKDKLAKEAGYTTRRKDENK